ncbi:MAG: AmmeMemoRadiSam system protein B [Proteobacteria bacterium]|nr:AmmeMemoRadiSam system protein B [Pseudomonadota bacterium]
MSTRYAIVAGRFYPSDKEELKADLSKLLRRTDKERIKALAVIAPHAGYVYSGKTAGKVYSSIEIPNTVIILSPNHTGYGSSVSFDPDDKWSTPLGDVDVDLEISDNILQRIKGKIPDAAFDPSAQMQEHALEVHIPFLQMLRPDVRIVPLTLSNLTLQSIKLLGVAIAEIIIEIEDKGGERPLIVASSDMTHFESADTAKKKDMMAIEKIKNLDTEGFIDVVERNNITLCGLYTIPVMMEAVKHYSNIKKISPKIELIDYTNSGDVTGDKQEVVAYAGMVAYDKLDS